MDNGSFMAKFLAAQAEAEAKGAPVLETAILQVAKPEATTTLAAKTRVDPAVSSANSGKHSTLSLHSTQEGVGWFLVEPHKMLAVAYTMNAPSA